VISFLGQQYDLLQWQPGKLVVPPRSSSILLISTVDQEIKPERLASTTRQ
jgi:hypothetical protein